MNSDEAKERLAGLNKAEFRTYIAKPLSETDTRCKLIDKLLIEVLGWQESSIERETKVTETGTYIDYVLSTNRPVFVVEAKRNGISFKLPSTRTRRKFKLGGVLTEDDTLKAAVVQVRDYAVAKGVPCCCVTNGSQYVFFRSQNDIGIDFWDHQAIVYSSIDEVLAHFLRFFESLAFSSVIEGSHLQFLPIVDDADATTRKFKTLSLDVAPDRLRDRNVLFPFIREVVVEVFRDLASDEASEELIEQCYVESARDSRYEHSLRALLKEKPALAERPLKPVIVTKKNAGAFEDSFDAEIKIKGGRSEVIILLGGIGAGKTTFIRRFRKVLAKKRIDEDCIWTYIDFNKFSDTSENLSKWVSDAIFRAIEDDYPNLGFGTFPQLKQAYHAEYERLKRGRLEPLFKRDPQEFEVEFGRVSEEFESDKIGHVGRLMRTAARLAKRRPFLVFDNADPSSGETQNEVFMLANRMAQDIGCSLIIALREESYWKNKDFGALSAFHAVLFHVEAPGLAQVLSKRFRYAAQLLGATSGNTFTTSGGRGVTHAEAQAVFECLKQTILGNDRRFIELLESLSPGEIRRPLEQLSRFMFSGHTNVNALLWNLRNDRPLTVGFHEFTKSIALADRELFDESKSDIINIFAADGAADANNLNRLAVIGRVLKSQNDKTNVGVGYIRLEIVIDDMTACGLSQDTVIKIIDYLNARRLFETERQITESVSGSEYVRATAAAQYYLKHLAQEFVYLDLVIPSTPIGDDQSFAILSRITSQIQSLGKKALADRLERLKLRVERAKCFANYIANEAQKFPAFVRGDKIDVLVSSYISTLSQVAREQGELAIRSGRALFEGRNP